MASSIEMGIEKRRVTLEILRKSYVRSIAAELGMPTSFKDVALREAAALIELARDLDHAERWPRPVE
jgi:hypothetical protein